MSNFNINWLLENLQENSTIFYIGAANLHDAVTIKKAFPKSKFYAFECSRFWVDQFPILEEAKNANINYFQLAMSDVDGTIDFYPCDNWDNNPWPVSSSIFAPNQSLDFLQFSEKVSVESTTLKTFSEKHNAYPDFIHIDVQGAEYKVFSKMGSHRPKIIWAETSEFNRYETGITIDMFYALMLDLGYKKIYVDGPDELYVQKDFVHTEYTPNIPVEVVPEKRLKFVFKERDHVSPFDIHGVGKTSFYNIAYQLHIAEDPYHPDNLPEDTFIYEYQHSWLIDPIKFFGDEGFFEMDPCPENVLQRIREKTAYLFITVPYESPLQFERLIKIHSYFKRHNLPASQVIYFTCCLNGSEVYGKYCSSIGEQPLCQIEYIAENLWINCHLSQKYSSLEYTPGFRKKSFLMFNRRWLGHAHRTLFLYNIYKMNMLDSFYMSFTKTDVDHRDIKYSTAVNNQYRNFYYKPNNPLDYTLLEELENKLPLVLDTDDLVSGALMYDVFDKTKSFYDDSFVHIVSETYFNTEIIHVTEKTYKPMIYRQPFVMLGPPNTLRKLRELGFKTFHEIWDESYDEMFDHTERFYKILQLCKTLHDMPMLKKINLMYKCKPIIEHNFYLLNNFKTNKLSVTDVIKKYNLQ